MDYISREDAINAINEWDKQDVYPPSIYLMVLADIPTADVKPVVRGKWKRKLVDYGFNADWVCDKCGYRVYADYVNYNYCPNCGADMRGNDNERE